MMLKLHQIGAVLIPALAAIVIAMPSSASAGPPFATDDPYPLPLYSGEFYLFATGGHASDGTTLDAAPGIETNFSFLPNTFLHIVAPLALNRPSGGPSAYGPGDLEVGFKWDFLRESRQHFDIGLFPLAELPTGDANRGLGSQKAQVFLPVWFGKEAGAWTSYGGRGYWINPGDGNRDWWFTGLLIQRQISQNLYLGAEGFHQTPDAVGGPASTGFDFGGGVTIAGPCQILFSAGRNIENVDANEFSFYAALYTVF